MSQRRRNATVYVHSMESCLPVEILFSNGLPPVHSLTLISAPSHVTGMYMRPISVFLSARKKSVGAAVIGRSRLMGPHPINKSSSTSGLGISYLIDT